MRFGIVGYILNNLFKNMFKGIEPVTLAALIGAGGSIGSGLFGMFGGGGDDQSDADAQSQRAYNDAQTRLASQNADFGDWWNPQRQDIYKNLYPVIQNRLQGKGMDPELEQQIWKLGQQRIGKSYGQAGTQLGESLAGQGIGRGGVAPQAWLNQIGLPQAQATDQFSTERALANYQAQSQAIGEASNLFGQRGPTGTGLQQVQQDAPIDYSGIGGLFAKGGDALSGFLSKGNAPGTTPGNTGGISTSPGSTFSNLQNQQVNKFANFGV